MNSFLLVCSKDVIEDKYFNTPDIDNARWLYFGKDIAQYKLIEEKFNNKNTEIQFARLQNDLSKELRVDYVKWMDDLNSRYGKSKTWWFGILASRNIYHSNCFQYFCYLEIIKNIVNTSASDHIIVIYEDLTLARIIEKWLFSNGIKSNELSNTIIIKQRIYFEFNHWYRACITIVKLFLRWLAAKWTRFRYGKTILPTADCVLIDTFVQDYCFSTDAIFQDRYFPFLHEFYKDNNIPVIVLPILHGFSLNFLSIYKQLRKSETTFIVAEDYLNMLDYIAIFSYPFLKYFQHSVSSLLFRGADFSLLVQKEARSLHGSEIESLLIYRLLYRLKKTGINLKLAVNWDENQNIDKALNLSIRKAFTQTKIIGVKHILGDRNQPSIFPISTEIKFGANPDLIFTTSQSQCNFIQTYNNEIPCIPVAGLRYTHLFEERTKLEPTFNPENILVLLPQSQNDSVNLLLMISRVITFLRESIKIVIRVHPTCSQIEIRQKFSYDLWPACFEFSSQTLSKELLDASVVVSTNTGAMVEAAAQGIPVIVVGNLTILSHNILEDVKSDMIQESFSQEELVKALRKFTNIPNKEKIQYRNMGAKIRDKFFLPLQGKTMMPFFNEFKYD